MRAQKYMPTQKMNLRSVKILIYKLARGQYNKGTQNHSHSIILYYL